MEPLELNHRYLFVEERYYPSIFALTVIETSEKAYRFKADDGRTRWELRKTVERDWSVVEDLDRKTFWPNEEQVRAFGVTFEEASHVESNAIQKRRK